MTDKDVATNEELESNTQEGVKASIENPSLTIQDLQGLANIIDLAARRGAFQARDMELVGTSFNKLIGFLSHVSEQQAAAAEDEPGDDGKKSDADDEAK